MFRIDKVYNHLILLIESPTRLYKKFSNNTPPHKPHVGLEPTTLRLEVLRAIQLRQQGTPNNFWKFNLYDLQGDLINNFNLL